MLSVVTCSSLLPAWHGRSPCVVRPAVPPRGRGSCRAIDRARTTAQVEAGRRGTVPVAPPRRAPPLGEPAGAARRPGGQSAAAPPTRSPWQDPAGAPPPSPVGFRRRERATRRPCLECTRTVT